MGETRSSGAAAEISVRHEGALAIVSLHGEHDIATAPDVRRALDGALSGAGALVVDLTPATFLDSTILGVLIGARDTARAAGAGYATFCGDDCQQGVRRILDVTGLIPLLPVCDSLDEARAAAGA